MKKNVLFNLLISALLFLAVLVNPFILGIIFSYYEDISLPQLNTMLWAVSIFFFILILIALRFRKNVTNHLKKNIGNYILLSATVIACLFMFEFAVGLLRPHPLDYDVVNYEYNYSVHLNSDHFRDDNFSELKTMTRGFLLGDSFAFGVGVDQNNTMDKLIEKACLAEGKPCEIYNLGEPATGPTDFVKNGLKLKHYNPDFIIVSIYVDNDIDTNLELLRRSMSNMALLKIPGMLNKGCPYPFLEGPDLDPYYRDLMCQGLANPFIYKRALLGDNQKYYDHMASLVEKSTLNSLLRLRSLDVPIILMINPSRYQLNTTDFNELKRLGFDEEGPTNRSIQDSIIVWANKNNLPYIDVLPEMGSGQYYYKVDDHYTPEGNQEATRILYGHLKARQLV
ncbi:hypothetical protein K9M79_04645 [Candidatus Woesearchaeota archaeon]|nr:hypothetical protein [Candidatus Woesearchaeota archaeon]